MPACLSGFATVPVYQSEHPHAGTGGPYGTNSQPLRLAKPFLKRVVQSEPLAAATTDRKVTLAPVGNNGNKKVGWAGGITIKGNLGDFVRLRAFLPPREGLMMGR